jgi:hypothetical protein
MHEGWHVAGMILTVQVVEKMRLEAQTMAQSSGQPDRCAKLPSNAGMRGNDHTIRPGPLWGIRS